MKKAGIGNGQGQKRGMFGRAWDRIKRRAPGVATNAAVSAAVGRAELEGNEGKANTIKATGALLGLVSLFLPDGVLAKAGEGAMHAAVSQAAAKEGAALSTLVLPLQAAAEDEQTEDDLDEDDLENLSRGEELAEQTTEELAEQTAQELATVSVQTPATY